MQARQAAMQERAAAEASRVGGGWAPLYEQSRRLSMMGAEGLGRGLFPQAQDPMLQKAQITQSIVNKYRGQDFNDPSVLSKMASEFSEAGQPELAMQLGDMARKLLPQKEKIFSDINPKDFTPESLKAFIDGGMKDRSLLRAIDKPEARKAIGKTSTGGEQVYQEGNEQFLLRNGQKVPYYGSLRKEQGDISLGATQEKRVLANKSALAAKVEENATSAVNQLSNAQAIGGVLGNAFTGVGSDVVLTIGQIANAFGVRVSGTTESEQLDQLLAALTAGQAKSLPGSLSEKELSFLKQAIGTRGVTKETLQATVNRLQEAAYSDIIGNNKLQQYIDEGKDLNKFNFAKNASDAKRLAKLLSKASPEQRRQILGE
jgi:hypothetical protein